MSPQRRRLGRKKPAPAQEAPQTPDQVLSTNENTNESTTNPSDAGSPEKDASTTTTPETKRSTESAQTTSTEAQTGADHDVPWDETDAPPVRVSKGQQKRTDKKERKLHQKLTWDEIKTIQDLLKHYNIAAAEWDYLIVGDGSGTGWAAEIGWGSTLICKSDDSRKEFFGSMSNGTNNTAELYAALHPLSYLVNTINWADRPQGLKVHVITDSQYVANGLNKDNPIWVASLALNRELWMAVHMTRRRGIEIKGHHMPRNSFDLAQRGHDLANASRKSLIGVLTDLVKDNKDGDANPTGTTATDREDAAEPGEAS